MDDKSMELSEYREAFDLDKEDVSDKLKAALEHAKDNRKFEIEMYWKRATYFWTLIAVAFAGYFGLLGSDKGASNSDEKPLLAFIISCIGFVFTYAWFSVNRGSKQWHENWDNHVDMLEDRIIGPLYKTMLKRSSDQNFFEKHFTGPDSYSVTKINQLVNLFTMGIWVLLCLHVSNLFPWPGTLCVERLLSLFLAIVSCVLIWKFGKTNRGKYSHVAKLRSSEIEASKPLKPDDGPGPL